MLHIVHMYMYLFGLTFIERKGPSLTLFVMCTDCQVFDYPSLNVKDLDTVDNGVMAHMVPELEAYDAEFVIGHFLGVDHVGHIYGPSHSTMAEKLSQMNEVLK